MMESVLGTRQRRKPERRTIVPRSRDFESEKENHESATNDNSDHFLTRGVMFKVQAIFFGKARNRINVYNSNPTDEILQ